MSSNYLRDTSTSSVTPGASTSSSSIQNRFKYDVFISFRGEDTRKNIVDHLYQALKDKGIYTYKDDEKIQKGKRISDDLFKSIEDSKFYIIVFSKNYASSSWCLEELVKIMECHKMHGHTAYPVFYDRLHFKESLIGSGSMKNTNDGHEAKFIKKIVGEISLELRSINSGFDEKHGGLGKTTTARAVFDHLSNDFEARSFVENVREVSNGAGLKKLLEQVLSNVLAEKVTLDSVNDGKNMMKRRLFGKKVLLVLDDVDHIDQLEALASGPNWFKPGNQEATSLFSKYAFGRENPLQGYEELSGKVVRYAAGLPLTVKVLGSFLCGKDRVEWVDAIERLEKIPLKETMEKLELSYTSLEDEYKEIFLDIACILKGQTKEDAIRILKCCGFHAINGLKVLKQRSLITISPKFGGYGELFVSMHDHIEEMGKNIVRREHPNEPNKHSRLWIPEEIEDILANDMGTAATRCLKLTTSKENSPIIMKGFGKMKKLQYLE
ncbi:disease resistance TIR-NBS-LRR class family protein, partial [Tanacetum coccineum]